jgi:hypothetical protein
MAHGSDFRLCALKVNDTGVRVSAHGRFLLQLAATTAGTLLDIVVGKWTDKPTLVLAVWAVLALVIAALFEFFKDTANDKYTIDGVRVSVRMVPGFFRPVAGYHFGVIVKAVFAALFAGLACCVLTLAVITWRFVVMDHGVQLGKGSPFDASIVVFVSNFQTSGAIASLVVGTFILAVVLKSEFVLPVGVLVASVVTAWQVPISANGIDAGAYRSDLAQSLSVLNGLLFHLPTLSMPLGCLIALGVGLAACGIVAACARS